MLLYFIGGDKLMIKTIISAIKRKNMKRRIVELQDRLSARSLEFMYYTEVIEYEINDGRITKVNDIF